MTDPTTNKALRVSTEGTAGPYIMVPFSQLDEVRKLLEIRKIAYWVSDNAISINGAPEVIIVNLGRGGDAGLVQSILDNAPVKFEASHGIGNEEGQAMTDVTTNKALRVSTIGRVGPYIRLPFSQLDELRRLLESHSVTYWVEENAFSWNGAPEVIVVNLGRGGDAALVQSILDNVN